MPNDQTTVNETIIVVDAESGNLKPASRFRMRHVELRPDLFFYERRLERGWTTTGNDFIHKPFAEPVPDVIDTPFVQFLQQGGPSFNGFLPMPFPQHIRDAVETGFVDAAGLDKIKALGMERISHREDPRLKDIHYLPHVTALPQLHPHVQFSEPTMDEMRAEGAVSRLYRPFGRRDSNQFVSLQGEPLVVALEFRLTTYVPDDYDQTVFNAYGPYDWPPLKAHLETMRGAVSLRPPEEYTPYASVVWRPTNDEFRRVWGAAELDNPLPTMEQKQNKLLVKALIDLDILGIAQFRRQPDPIPERKSRSKSKRV